MSDKIGIVILAAGEGTRLKLELPKPLAPMCNQTLIDFPIQSSIEFLEKTKQSGHLGLVLGHEKEQVSSYIDINFSESKFKIYKATQNEQLGTADAVNSYLRDVKSHSETEVTFILCADTPVISSNELEILHDKLINEKRDAVAATFKTETPKGYGRIIRGGSGFKIVEEKDATEEQRSVTEVNSGFYAIKTKFLVDAIKNIDNKNNSGEFYLTDLFKEDGNVEAICFEEADVFIGVNDLQQLQRAEKILRWKKMRELREEGVRFIDLSHTYVDPSVSIASGSVIYPNVFIEGNSVIDKNCIIEPGSIIRNSHLEEGVEIKAYSHLEDVVVRKQAAIGPYGRLRPGADIGEEAKIGNFVEVKKAVLKKGAKVSHLSYVGDAEIGENTNIGCGFITCNYDGAQKHKTIIGKDCFIGSDTQMVAPVEVGEGSFVASGSTINQNIPNGSFAIARSKQVTKENMAKKFLKSKK